MGQEMMDIENQDLEIDLKALFMKIKSLWYICLIGLLVGAICMVGYSVFLKTPIYSATSKVYLRTSSEKVSLQDLQLGSELTKDYEIIFKSRPNMEKVAKKLNLNYSASQLASMITIDNPSDTRILTVTVKSTSPTEAMKISNTLMEFGMDNIREIDSQEPYLIEKAIENPNPIGKSTLTMTILGALIGLVLAVGAITVRFIFSDKITGVEDVEKSLGLPVLAVVMDDRSLKYTKKKYARK